MRKAPAPLVLALLGLAPLPAHAGGGTSLRAMIEITRIDSPAISPDGRYAVWRQAQASIERNAFALAWYIAPTDGSAPPRRIADAGEPMWLNGSLVVNPPVWTADSRTLLFRKLEHGEIQIWGVSTDGGEARQISHEPGNVRDLAARDAGNTFIFGEGPPRADITAAEQAEHDEGTLVDASVDPQRPLYRGDWIDGRWASGRLRGFWFEQGGILPARPASLRVLDVTSGTVRDASAAEKQSYAPPAKAFDQLGDSFVIDRVASGDARGAALVLGRGVQYELAVQGTDGRLSARCHDSACTTSPIRSVRWLGTDNAVVFETRDGAGRTTLSRWDVRTNTVAPIATGTGTLNGGDEGQGCAATVMTMLCVAASANEPPRVVAISVVDGAQHVIADPNGDLVPLEPQFTPLSWTDTKGRTFTGFLAMPEHASHPAPLFITYYSCSGFLRGGLGEEFPLRDLARSGIAAMCINRLPGRLGGGGNAESYRDAADGIGAIIDKLAGEGRIDPARVGMGGVSFGGEVAMWLAMHTRRLAALSVANVMVTPTYYWLNAVKGREVPRILQSGWGLGNPDTDRKGWREASPAFNIDRISAPLLMQLPEQEYRPNVELLARLQAAGKPVELFAFPGEMHIKWQPRHQFAANTRNLDWFRFWLLGEVDPAPSKAAQYARWQGYGAPSQARAQASVSIKGNSR